MKCARCNLTFNETAVDGDPEEKLAFKCPPRTNKRPSYKRGELCRSCVKKSLGVAADPTEQPYKNPVTALVDSKEDPLAHTYNAAHAELVARELCRRRLIAYVVRMQPEYKAGWFHKDIADRLEKFSLAIERGESPRLILQAPPRHGKSQLTSVHFPSWFLGRNPDKEVIACSYASALADDFSKKVRANLREDRYHKVFSTKLDPDSQNTSGWKTTKQGGYVPSGVGGPITGRGAHCLIIDDFVKNAEEAQSEVSREAIWEWYTSTAYTRLAPGGGIIVIATRWHFDDLIGRLIQSMEDDNGDNWEVISYPAIALEDEKYRREGEALHPERYPLEQLERIRRAVGPSTWQALYQQQPTSDDGDYFTTEMFRWYNGSPPTRMRIYAAWDFAIGKGDRNDWTVGIVAGVDVEENMWVLDVRRGRWDTFEIVEQMLDVQRAYRPAIQGIERGQLSMAMGPYLEQRIKEEKMYELYAKDIAPGRRDKELRARAIQGRMRQGMVRFPVNAAWMGGLMVELKQFPNGQHDDQVDALAYLGLLLQEMDTPGPVVEIDPFSQGWRRKLSAFVAGSGRRSAMSA